MAVDYKFMASFNKDIVESDVFSEADAVTYRLELYGATNSSSAPMIKVNGVSIGTTFVDGLNIRGFVTPDGKNSVVKSYLLTSNESTMNAGFIEYMSMVKEEISIFVSGKNLKSSPTVDKWFADRGSLNWPGNWLSSNHQCGYVGIYSKSRNKIIAEVLKTTDGSDKDRAYYLAVYDELKDLGSLGFPSKVVDDSTEYSSSSAYEYKRFPSTTAISKMVDYGLGPEASLLISCDMFQDQTILNDGMKTRVNIRWYQGNTLKLSDVIENDNIGWTANNIVSTAPVGSDGFTIVAYRHPRNDAATGKSAIKNMVCTEVSANLATLSTAAIGVNGIKASTYVEKQTAPRLMDLRLDINSMLNTVNVVGIREGDTGVAPTDWEKL